MASRAHELCAIFRNLDDVVTQPRSIRARSSTAMRVIFTNAFQTSCKLVLSFSRCALLHVLIHYCSFECVPSAGGNGGMSVSQMTPIRPVPSGGDLIPYTLIGARDAVNISLVVDALIPGMNLSRAVAVDWHQHMNLSLSLSTVN